MHKLNIIQSGQTLIETIVAIFILTTALTAGLALTIYAISHSDRTSQEIVGTNLAREGIDVVRNMRDTNWLESDGKSIWDLDTGCNIGSSATFPCYPKAWEGVPGGAGSNHFYSLSADTFRLEFDNISNSWTLASGPPSYALYKANDGSYTHRAIGSPIYYRKITISHNFAAPFSASDSPYNLSELIVTSVVGWTGRGCTPMVGAVPDPSTTNCSVAASENLTNWKDYR